MSLEEIIEEAKKAGLEEKEIEIATRQYYLGIREYNERNPKPEYHKYRNTTLGILAHERDMKYCAEAYARKYIEQKKRK